ncbi:hypothetical protein ACFLV7_05230, partial [Chloroflexota bacterium]
DWFTCRTGDGRFGILCRHVVEINFSDPDEIPLQPNDVRIRALRVNPLSDGRLVHVYLEVDPFQKRPSVDLTICDNVGQEASSTSIIESVDRNIEIRMHVLKFKHWNLSPCKGTLTIMRLLAKMQCYV